MKNKKRLRIQLMTMMSRYSIELWTNGELGPPPTSRAGPSSSGPGQRSFVVVHVWADRDLPSDLRLDRDEDGRLDINVIGDWWSKFAF